MKILPRFVDTHQQAAVPFKYDIIRGLFLADVNEAK